MIWQNCYWLNRIRQVPCAVARSNKQENLHELLFGYFILSYFPQLFQSVFEKSFRNVFCWRINYFFESMFAWVFPVLTNKQGKDRLNFNCASAPFSRF